MVNLELVKSRGCEKQSKLLIKTSRHSLNSGKIWAEFDGAKISRDIHLFVLNESFL